MPFEGIAPTDYATRALCLIFLNQLSITREVTERAIGCRSCPSEPARQGEHLNRPRSEDSQRLPDCCGVVGRCLPGLLSAAMSVISTASRGVQFVVIYAPRVPLCVKGGGG